MPQNGTPKSWWWNAVFGVGSLGRYGVLGFSGIAVDVVSYWGLVTLGLLPVVSTVISSFLGIVTNYLANALLNFRVPLRGHQAVRFVLVGLVGLVVAAGVLQLMILVGSGPWWAKVVSLAVVVPAQFLINKKWTFR